MCLETRFVIVPRPLLLLLFCLGAAAGPLCAQQPAEQPAGEGWASAWTEPQTPREKALHAFAERLANARKSHDFGPLLAEYERLVHEHPDDLTANGCLLAIHTAMKRYNEGLADLDRATAISQRAHAPAIRFAIIDYDRSFLHQDLHDYAAQAADLERALQNDQTSYHSLNSLAWLRATNPDPALQNGDEAVRLANRAIQVTGRHFDELDTLAAAYAAQGNYSRAIALQKEAITLINQDERDAAKAAHLLRKASVRLDLYVHNQPDREIPNDPTS